MKIFSLFRMREMLNGLVNMTNAVLLEQHLMFARTSLATNSNWIWSLPRATTDLVLIAKPVDPMKEEKGYECRLLCNLWRK
jgi:hypothetical protein